MAVNSSIEWTDATWNPVAGCSIVSPGCKNCYAMRTANRFSGIKGHKYQDTAKSVDGHPVWTGKINLVEKDLAIPLHWREPRRIFVNSMSDLFHPDVPFDFIDKVFAVAALCPQHTFQILTKRPERMAKYICSHDIGLRWSIAADPSCATIGPGTAVAWSRNGLPNVWIGTSVERQKEADERIPHLLKCPAAVRFLSCEPLLGPIDLNKWLVADMREGGGGVARLNQIHWAIVGGESGPGARPMHPNWARTIRDQCQRAGVPFFFKQWGEFGVADESDGIIISTSKRTISLFANGQTEFTEEQKKRYSGNPVRHACGTCALMYRVGKKGTGRLLDGREWNEFPALHQEATA